jgi:hypothetical protein
MAYVPPGKEYYVRKTKARIADLERQLLPHRADDLALRPTVIHVGTQIPDMTCIVVDHLERQLRSQKAALARYEAWKS